MRNSTRVIVLAAGFSFAVCAVHWRSRPLSAAQDSRVAGDVNTRRLLRVLDDCLQGRFRDVNEGFGMSRVIRPGETAHRFKPENAREMTVVRDLELANRRVVFYLASRRVLKTMPDPGSWGARDGWGIIKGPVQIASTVSAGLDADDSSPPRARDLWDDSRRAMESFVRGDSHEFVNAGWTFIARPVRASDESCVRCHGAAVKIGDAIGAALYGYR